MGYKVRLHHFKKGAGWREAVKMAQSAKDLPCKPDDLSLIPETYTKLERTDYTKLSSDFRVCAHTQNKIKIKRQIYKKCLCSLKY